MRSIDTFQTQRLLAERLRAEHLGDFCRMHQDPKVMATLTAHGGILSENETQQSLENNLEHWDRYGFGLWVFRDKVDGQFVGRGGLRNLYVDGKQEVELAYALRSEFWGKGLATEMGEAILRLGFEELCLADIICFTLTTNYASQRVMEKLGFKYERNMIYAGLPHVFYRLNASAKQFS
ncbi:MAG: GNAT family N-acetyltransferase [Aetokthonos hydrillicola CCALA 1050]|jgi:RimJ/RimL family protein N-acetyltransferase|nr:GNAT family N-acetyltransferase [Aetokthonos hydrillicola CCALA 1050]MBW4588565.1 GNAT family N-acetyltransferase [Aetokthonos hydrillicola CCALA 1050]